MTEAEFEGFLFHALHLLIHLIEVALNVFIIDKALVLLCQGADHLQYLDELVILAYVALVLLVRVQGLLAWSQGEA